jgi:NADH-quinone oxidoreductase subunit J
MLDINMDHMRKGFWKHFPLAAGLGTLVALEMAAVLMGGFRITERPAVAGAVAELSNTKELGRVLYTQYLYPLQAAAVILLVAIIAAIALTLRERKDSKAIDAADQIRVKPGERVRLVKVKPSAQQVAPPAAAAEESKP